MEQDNEVIDVPEALTLQDEITEVPEELLDDPIESGEDDSIVGDEDPVIADEKQPVEVVSEEQSYIPQNKLFGRFEFSDKEYTVLKSEVKVFFYRIKSKNFGIRPSQDDHKQLAFEYIYKIKPILQFMVVRDMDQGVTAKIKQVLFTMDSFKIDYVVKRLNITSSYGRNLAEYKLDKILESCWDELTELTLFMFNLQPTRDRKVSSDVAGVGQDEYDQMLDE